MASLMVPGRVFAALYDKLNAEVEEAFAARMRAALLAPAHGAVLELGAGTGANVEHYPPVERLVLSEPDRHMRARLAAKVGAGGRSAEVVDAGADALPFADATFDVVVSTLVLCTVPDPAAAVREVARVLRPGGRFLFAEHVRAARPRKARMQDVVRPVWQVLMRGCHPNRDTLATIAAGGLDVEHVDHVIVPKVPSISHEAVVGTARRPG